jgi:outer membrane biosynthesis protein TonB
MRKSAFISTALHIAILLWALVAFPNAKMDASAPVEIPVDLATPAEFTKLKAGMVDAKDEAPLAPKPDAPKQAAVTEKEPPKEPDQVAAVPPPPAAEEKVETPKPEPKPEKSEAAPTPKPEKAEEKPEPKKEEPKKAEPPPKPAKEAKDDKPKKPKPAPQAKKHDFNTDRIAALLNKIPDAAKAPQAKDAPRDTPDKPVHGQSNGTQMTMSVNEIDALRARIAQCWSPPPGGLGADDIVVKIRLKLNEDGTLVGYPSITNSGGSSFFQAAADSAVRAVYQCQPYTLPADKYSVWRDMILNFDPRQMYGSG